MGNLQETHWSGRPLPPLGQAPPFCADTVDRPLTRRQGRPGPDQRPIPSITAYRGAASNRTSLFYGNLVHLRPVRGLPDSPHISPAPDARVGPNRTTLPHLQNTENCGFWSQFCHFRAKRLKRSFQIFPLTLTRVGPPVWGAEPFGKREECEESVGAVGPGPTCHHSSRRRGQVGSRRSSGSGSRGALCIVRADLRAGGLTMQWWGSGGGPQLGKRP